MALKKASPTAIQIRGARQNNLKNLDVDILPAQLTVVTGPSGSGKSSLVFDTLYAEGQRRYVETFSAYARQFLDRMDRPAVDSVEGVPPAIAIDQTNPVRTSRSTVGTMTELNDHFKLLFARAAHLFDRQTAKPVRHDTVQTIQADLLAQAAQAGDPRLVLTFPVELPAHVSEAEVEQWLSISGFTRVQAQHEITTAEGVRKQLDVVADRFRASKVEGARLAEGIETCLMRGGRLNVYVLGEDEKDERIWRYSKGLHCPESDLTYAEPTPSLFSFNSAYGACEACRGFGRVVGVDWSLVIPDEKLTLRGGAIKPIQTPAWIEMQDNLMLHAEEKGVPRDTPWHELSAEHKHWVLEGEPVFKEKDWFKKWAGIRRFFQYLETKSYKMHIRVLLSKYRSYTECPTCKGARLKTEALLWRVGSKEQADAVLLPEKRFMPEGVAWMRDQLESLPGLCLHDLMLLPIDKLQQFMDMAFPAVDKTDVNAEDEPLQLLYDEIRTRLRFLVNVGIAYLTLDRQSRTLSGGEVQRINLTTALGTSLVNTMFVLDEPSIGLHPRDMDRIIDAMHRLRDAGNTLVVVEHDPAVMLSADRILDMGPGPGEKGGEIVFDGTPKALRQSDTLTGQYLSGRKSISIGIKRLVTEKTPKLVLQGAHEHNLKNIDVEFPLYCLSVVTGVSGSGKSTLIQDVLYPALCRHLGKPTEGAGAYDQLLGADWLADAVFVDQSPIGKTARSNPASYVGAWDAIRTLFALTATSKERGYTASKFSFNSGDGRCPTCGGSGFEHVEMQFLSDVYLRCPDCDGKRYRPEVLEVELTRQGKNYNVADVLDMTVSEAVQAFAADSEVVRTLQPILDVGLEYVKLGQPVPTLSGGEAQRLKLAGFLAQAKPAKGKSGQPLAKKGTLFLFDEPTTGLHFDDIAKLMQAFRKLLDAGNSIILIEHNLDVIRASDWLIDLGPDGGDAGGQVLCVGKPEEVRESKRSYTGMALKAYEKALGSGEMFVAEGNVAHWLSNNIEGARQSSARHQIEVIHARENNLKALSVNIPHNQFNVITGVSGSGKSTLAFDIIFGEGQRRYLESLNAYARSIVQPAGRAKVDAVYGIPPTVAIEQRLSRGGRKSTVGTATELWHYLRLLYVKLGVQHCIHDGAKVQPQTPQSMVAQLLKQYKGKKINLLGPLVIGRKGIYKDLAAWAHKNGFAQLRVDGEFLPTEKFPKLDRYVEHTIELPVVDILVNAKQESALREALEKALEHGKGVMHVLSEGQVDVFSTLRACPVCHTSYPELDPRLFSYNSKHGWCPDCVG
ncbi:MAG: excinuclease ABC subunit UvrA, partial [Saezia sp.]